MPPKDAEKQLTATEKEIISQWIHEGGQYAKHWAFVSPTKPKVDANGNPIDHFIGVRLKSSGVDFAKPAEKATLARRAALVLTGLPPEPEQLSSFLSDNNHWLTKSLSTDYSLVLAMANTKHATGWMPYDMATLMACI